ncbi:MAG: LysR family transcriptional regulator [Pseudomonadota bacterium]
MNLDTLRLFIDVANRLSFAAVADEHGISASSVSRAIAQLEQSLGVRLFQRTTRTMSLTESGALYAQHVAGIIEALAHAEDQARSVSRGPAGTLRLTASVAFGERVIVPLIGDFKARYPELKLDLLFTDTAVDLVDAGVDLAVRLGPRPSGDVVATRLCATRYRVVASPTYVETAATIRVPEDLAHHPCTVFALPGFRSCWRFRALHGGGGHDTAVDISAETTVTSALSLRSIVLGGGGPALLAGWLIGDDIAAGRLVDVLPEHQATATDFDTAAWLVYPSRAYLPSKVRVAIDFLKSRVSVVPG